MCVNVRILSLALTVSIGFFAADADADEIKWTNCATISTAAGAAAGAAGGAAIGGKVSSGSTLGKWIGGGIGALTGAFTACSIFNNLGKADTAKAKQTEKKAVASNKKTKKSWTTKDGQKATYTAAAKPVKVKEKPGTACKQVGGKMTISEKDGGEKHTATNEDLYCQTQDGTWTQAKGTVL